MLLTLALLASLAHAPSQEPGPPEADEAGPLTVIARAPEGVREIDYAVFSPDGSRVAWTGTQGGKSTLFVNAEERGAHTFLDSMVWSVDGEHLAWRAGDTKSKTSEVWRIYLDGKAGPKYAWAGSPAIAPDGKTLAYWAAKGVKLDKRTGIYEGGDYFVVHGKSKSGKYPDGGMHMAPQIRPDGKEVAFSAFEGGGHTIVAGKKEYDGYSMVGRPVWHPDGKTVAWPAVEGGQALVLESGKKKKPVRHDYGYRGVGSPRYSADGKHLAWKAARKGEAFVVLDGDRVGAAFHQVGTPVFAPEGTGLAWVGRSGGPKPGPPMPPGMGDDFDFPFLLMDGEEDWIYMNGEVEGTWHLVVDGEVRLDGEKVSAPVWSPDGERVACRVRSGGTWQVAVDDWRSEPFDDLYVLRFRADGAAVEFGARRDRELVWVERALE